MSLDTQQFMLIEQRVTNEAKSVGAAYLLWFFLGGIGVHRFYLGRIKTGILMVILSVLGWITIFAYGFGLLFLIPLAIWVLIDAFLIPGIIQRHKDKVRSDLTNQALSLSTTERTRSEFHERP